MLNLFSIGQTFDVPFVLTKEIYNGFILISKDKNPLHTDEDFAKSKGFDSVVMHGNILNSFLSYFIGECLPTKNVIIHSQEIQFKNPVYLGDNISLKCEVADFSEAVNVVQFKYIFRRSVDNKVLAKGKVQIGLI